jgi:hypothetical protein
MNGGVSRAASVTQPGALWNAQLGGVAGLVALVVQAVPSAQVPLGMQLAGPGVEKDVQPAGSAGGVTVSKLSFNDMMVQDEGVGVTAGVGLAVGVGVGFWQPVLSWTAMASIRQPVPAPLQSVARRKRRRTFWFAAETGIWANVVTYPPELPVHAARPAIGLKDPDEIVPL